jgi:hypothetical protein
MTVRSPRLPKGSRSHPELQRALVDWQAAAVRLNQVDPLTTELVRLRCAQHHDCHT